MELFSGLSWNVRGCNNITNRRNVKSHVQHSKVNFLCLQETKCNRWVEAMINSIWDANTHMWLEAPANGQSGGILTSWDTKHFQISNHTITNSWILFVGTTTMTNTKFACINVYAP